jgi:hypothetical protein
MSADDQKGISGLLSSLPAAAPDAARAARVRARCRTVLARQRRTEAAVSTARQTLARRAVETAFVGGFCVIYFSAIVVRALQGLLLNQP